MSQQLLLVEYPCDEMGRMYEPETNLIQMASIDTDMVSFFDHDELFEESVLFEDQSFEDFTRIKRLKEDRIGLALERIAAKLMQVLDSERVENLKTLQTEAEVSTLMGELQAITGAYHLIKLKRDSFAASSSTVVMLG
ncbi:hypothetical protein [Pseudomonas lactucae]|uniref:Uncharacterized protein n=1 Tax=Pseudomonas lactucae TaxID=2813360 RepID=A0A9X1C630_9PSED|nr:hypothetical protein [Pseudomonas lactucae]MBN2976387.1 hypothetical protein [Pseudomonas lactucae]MBN2987398.1 hypothetical protein [Pseudomonas lactucae]